MASSDEKEVSQNTRLRTLHNSNPKGVKFTPKIRSSLETPPVESVKIEADPKVPSAEKSVASEPPKDGILARARKALLNLCGKVRFTPAVALVGGAGLVILFAVFSVGIWAGQWIQARNIAARQNHQLLEFSKVAQNRLSAAMKQLREGNAREALRAFSALEAEFPDIPSVNYLSAVAAMQAGDMDQAEALVAKSLQAGERESDAFALQAILETQRAASHSKINLGDPTLRSEKLLLRAVLADPANPLPFIELATLMRYKGRHEEALNFLQAAQARLQPVDSHVVVDVTLELVRLEDLTVEQLPAADGKSDNVNVLLPAAYVALRRDNFDEAAAILKKCRGLLSPDLYDYLVNDPAFRKFAYRTELKTAFQR